MNTDIVMFLSAYIRRIDFSGHERFLWLGKGRRKAEKEMFVHCVRCTGGCSCAQSVM